MKYLFDCFSCGRKVTTEEFNKCGGLCIDCFTEIRQIYDSGGTYDDVIRFMESKMTVVNDL